VFGDFDHVGMIVRDLGPAVEEARARFGMDVARRATLEPWGIEAVYLGEGTGTLELFTLADPQGSAERLAGADVRLDHVAFRVADLESVAAMLRGLGVRFGGPDRRAEVEEPIDLGGAHHLWTLPQTSVSLGLQLFQPPAG
jgi:catechol 2,3-dioxygenase-like lactoylglutathione lyase family enzyme